MEGKSELRKENITTLQINVSKIIKLICKMIAHERRERPAVLEAISSLRDAETVALGEITAGQNPDNVIKNLEENQHDAVSETTGKQLEDSIIHPNAETTSTTTSMKSEQNVRREDGLIVTEQIETLRKAKLGFEMEATKAKEALKHQLHLAASNGDEQAIKDLIALGADVNAKNVNLETTITLAATFQLDGNVTLNIIKYLIQHGADATVTDGEGHTFLHKLTLTKCPLSSSQFHDIASYLVSKQMSTLFNIQDKGHGRTPLMLAAANVDLGSDTLSLLHEKGVDFRLADKDGNCVLFYATQGEMNRTVLLSLLNLGTFKLEKAIDGMDLKLVKLLVEFGADVNARNNDMETPILRAAASHDKAFAVKVIKFLLKNNASGTATDDLGETLLHKLFANGTTLVASEFGDISKYLVKKGLSNLFNIPDKQCGATPLMLAAKHVELDMTVLSYLVCGCVVDATLVDKNGYSYIIYAAHGKKNPKLLTELKHNGTLNETLKRAIEDMDEDIVKVLLTFVADENDNNNNNSGLPLHLAAKFQNATFAVKIVKFLIDSGANAYAKDRESNTFLHKLLERRPIFTPDQIHDISSFLVSKKLSSLFNTPGGFEITPFMMAIELVELQSATLSLLKMNGVDFNAVDKHGWSVLYFATMGNRSTKLIFDLVHFGANPKHLTNDKWSMLHLAATKGNVELVEFILDKGVDVNTIDKDGLTPLQYVLYKSRHCSKVVELLMNNGAKRDIDDDDDEIEITRL